MLLGAAQVEMAATPADPAGGQVCGPCWLCCVPGRLRAPADTWRRLWGPGGRSVAMRVVVQFRACGGPDVLQWGDAPDPRASQRRIRVSVRAAGVNPVDWKTFAGTMSSCQWGNLREADRG